MSLVFYSLIGGTENFSGGTEVFSGVGADIVSGGGEAVSRELAAWATMRDVILATRGR